MRKTLIPLLAFVFIVSVVAGSYLFMPTSSKNSSSGLYVDPPGGDFTLQSIKGDISLSDYKDKVVFLYFGYTFCPDVCPTSLSRIGAAFKKLNEDELKQVQGILISVDPERDTVQKLHDYTKYFHPQIIGATSDKATIDEIAKRYDVKYRKAEGSSATGYLVDHTGYIFVLDKNGKISTFLPHVGPVDEVVETIRKLLK